MFRLQVEGIITTVIQVIFESCWPDILSAGVGANTDLTVGVKSWDIVRQGHSDALMLIFRDDFP